MPRMARRRIPRLWRRRRDEDGLPDLEPVPIHSGVGIDDLLLRDVVSLGAEILHDAQQSIAIFDLVGVAFFRRRTRVRRDILFGLVAPRWRGGIFGRRRLAQSLGERIQLGEDHGIVVLALLFHFIELFGQVLDSFLDGGGFIAVFQAIVFLLQGMDLFQQGIHLFLLQLERFFELFDSRFDVLEAGLGFFLLGGGRVGVLGGERSGRAEQADEQTGANEKRFHAPNIETSQSRCKLRKSQMTRELTSAGPIITVGSVTLRPEAGKFLRASVKTGLRLQRSDEAERSEKEKSAGLRTLQRIKSSLRKRTSNRK